MTKRAREYSINSEKTEISEIPEKLRKWEAFRPIPKIPDTPAIPHSHASTQIRLAAPLTVVSKVEETAAPRAQLHSVPPAPASALQHGLGARLKYNAETNEYELVDRSASSVLSTIAPEPIADVKMSTAAEFAQAAQRRATIDEMLKVPEADKLLRQGNIEGAERVLGRELDCQELRDKALVTDKRRCPDGTAIRLDDPAPPLSVSAPPSKEEQERLDKLQKDIALRENAKKQTDENKKDEPDDLTEEQKEARDEMSVENQADESLQEAQEFTNFMAQLDDTSSGKEFLEELLTRRDDSITSTREKIASVARSYSFSEDSALKAIGSTLQAQLAKDVMDVNVINSLPDRTDPQRSLKRKLISLAESQKTKQRIQEEIQKSTMTGRALKQAKSVAKTVGNLAARAAASSVAPVLSAAAPAALGLAASTALGQNVSQVLDPIVGTAARVAAEIAPYQLAGRNIMNSLDLKRLMATALAQEVANETVPAAVNSLTPGLLAPFTMPLKWMGLRDDLFYNPELQKMTRAQQANLIKNIMLAGSKLDAANQLYEDLGVVAQPALRGMQNAKSVAQSVAKGSQTLHDAVNEMRAARARSADQRGVKSMNAAAETEAETLPMLLKIAKRQAAAKEKVAKAAERAFKSEAAQVEKLPFKLTAAVIDKIKRRAADEDEDSPWLDLQTAIDASELIGDGGEEWLARRLKSLFTKYPKLKTEFNELLSGGKQKGGGISFNSKPCGQDDGERLMIILGEVEAGNDSYALLRDLKKLLTRMEQEKTLPLLLVRDIRKSFLRRMV